MHSEQLILVHKINQLTGSFTQFISHMFITRRALYKVSENKKTQKSATAKISKKHVLANSKTFAYSN